jgi:hypothetical protein
MDERPWTTEDGSFEGLSMVCGLASIVCSLWSVVCRQLIELAFSTPPQSHDICAMHEDD